MNLDFIKMEILATGILILAAYIGGKVARRLKIGEVIGQILGGLIVGPHFLEIVHRFFERNSHLAQYGIFKPVYSFYANTFPQYASILEGAHFFVFLFLGIVAFSIGEELHRERLKQLGLRAVAISVIESFITWVVISTGFYLIFDFSLVFSLLIGSIGIATAPALSFILMSRLKIEGRLRNILANIVVLDDVIEVTMFSIIFGIALANQERGHELHVVELAGEVGWELLLALLVGLGIFLVLRFMIQARSKEEAESEEESEGFLSTVLSDHPTPSIEILFIILGVVSIGIAIAINFNLPFLITAVVAGFLISNFHSHAIFDSLKLRDVMPLFNLLFFGIIGASVRIETFSGDTLLLVLGYIGLRSVSKFGGNWLGCKITGQEPKITAALPRLMLPQAGMAAVETILVARALEPSGGMIIFNTVVPAIVFFELTGAYLSEKTLLKWKSWVTGEREVLEQPDIAGTGMSLQGLIGDRAMQLVAKTKNDALFELVRLLSQQGLVTDTSRILSAIREREQLASTAAGNGVAFPHCRSEAVNKTVAVCGISESPIDWEGKERSQVDLIFLIVSPAEEPEQHLNALRTISVALKQRDIREGLRTAINQSSVDGFIRKVDQEAAQANASAASG